MDEKRKPLGPEVRLDSPALAQIQKLAEVGLMTSAVLHEVKQPLAGIKGYAQIIREAGGPAVAEKVEAILAQVERIEQLVANHRRFLQADPGTKTWVDLGTVAKQATFLIEPKTRQSGAVLELLLPPEPVKVQAVEGQLLQIVVNLVTNAVDAVHASIPRKVQVLVRSDGVVCELSVSDSGPGLAQGGAEKLFTPFFTTKAEGGTGLGLFISRTLAEANGGSLEHSAATEQPFRTTFRLRFGPPPAPESLVATAQAAASVQPKRPAVLIVDDEDVVCQLLTNLLQSEGVDIHVAANGTEALEVLAKQRFDLVISDKNLPGASGLDVARATRMRYPACPVILMTGYPSLETAQEGLALGLIDYIEKPFDDIAEIRRQIREALKPAVEKHARGASRRVLVIDDRVADAVKIGEAVSMAGGVPIVASTISEALSHLSVGGAAGVVLSLDLKDKDLTPRPIRSLCDKTGGALVTVCDRLTLEQTVSAIRMGAAACLPRALASPQALSKELARVLNLGSKGGEDRLGLHRTPNPLSSHRSPVTAFGDAASWARERWRRGGLPPWRSASGVWSGRVCVYAVQA